MPISATDTPTCSGEDSLARPGAQPRGAHDARARSICGPTVVTGGIGPQGPVGHCDARLIGGDPREVALEARGRADDQRAGARRRCGWRTCAPPREGRRRARPRGARSARRRAGRSARPRAPRRARRSRGGGSRGPANPAPTRLSITAIRPLALLAAQEDVDPAVRGLDRRRGGAVVALADLSADGGDRRRRRQRPRRAGPRPQPPRRGGRSSPRSPPACRAARSARARRPGSPGCAPRRRARRPARRAPR